MARVKRAVNAQKKRRVVLERASGYRGQRSRLYRKAKEQVTHSLVYSYNDRRKKQGRLPSALDPADQRRRPRQRHHLQPVHPGPQGRRGRGGPQDPGRPRRQRRRRPSPPSSRPPRPTCPRTSTLRLLPEPAGRHTNWCQQHAIRMTSRPLTSRSGRVKAARRLRQRKAPRRAPAVPRRGRQGAHRGAGGAAGVVEVFATLAASEQYAALRKAVDEAGLPWQVADDDAVASLSGAVDPAGRRRRLPLPRRLPRRRASGPARSGSLRRTKSCLEGPARHLRRRARPGQRRHRDPHRRRGGSELAWCWPGTASTPTTTRPSAPPSAASGTCRSPCTSDPAAAVRRGAGGGCTVLAADGAGETRPVRGRGVRAARRPGRLAVRQRGLGAARRARGAGRPPGRRSRSAAAPRASTWPPRRPSASTPAPGAAQR